MEMSQLTEKLELHRKYLAGEEGGVCLDLRNADLQGVRNLRGVDLWEANLSEADLQGADLEGTELQGANLRCTNLRKASLRGADFERADLRGADLRGVNLWRAYLRKADLRGADLRKADLRGADLEGADLAEVDLRNTNLRNAQFYDANLTGAILPDGHQICPPVGIEFPGWKKRGDGAIVELLIPSTAGRCNGIGSRKCRASEAVVVGVIGGDGINLGGSLYSGVEYLEGMTVTPNKYDSDIRVSCTNGIHFFLTEQEAQKF